MSDMNRIHNRFYSREQPLLHTIGAGVGINTWVGGVVQYKSGRTEAAGYAHRCVIGSTRQLSSLEEVLACHHTWRPTILIFLIGRTLWRWNSIGIVVMKEIVIIILLPQHTTWILLSPSEHLVDDLRAVFVHTGGLESREGITGASFFTSRWLEALACCSHTVSECTLHSCTCRERRRAEYSKHGII